MNKYEVGIFIEQIIEAEDDIDAIHEFWENISYKDCYVNQIDEEDGDQE